MGLAWEVGGAVRRPPIEPVISSSERSRRPPTCRLALSIPFLQTPSAMKIVFASSHEITPHDWIDPLAAALPGPEVVLGRPALTAQEADHAGVGGGRKRVGWGR